jgi:DNA topoisomerase IB
VRIAGQRAALPYARDPRTRLGRMSTAADRDREDLTGRPPPKGYRIVENTSKEVLYRFKWFDKKLGLWHQRSLKTDNAKRAKRKYRLNHAFGSEILPKIRARYTADLKKDGKERVLALIVALMDQVYFRVGNEDSAHKRGKKKTFGITTLRRGQVKFKDGGAVFDFTGKAGVPQHHVMFDDTLLGFLKVLHRTAKTASSPLFHYQGEPITDAQVRAYLKRIDPRAKPKDFRTYHATHMTYEMLLARDRPSLTPEERAAIEEEVLKHVAEELGHMRTNAEGQWVVDFKTTRDSYVDPEVLTAWKEGTIRELDPL